MSAESLRQVFRERFGVQPRVFRAPGRVNLIGEHTDYNDGFVMPVAIELATHVAAAARDDRQVQVQSLGLGESYCFDVNDIQAQPRRAWTDYVQGVAISLERAGVALVGANLLIESDVPIGAGLSSSAALEVATAMALLAIATKQLAAIDVATICQEAENRFVGAHCGIMDQFAVCQAKADHALLLDCRTLEYKHLPLPDRVRLVVVNSMVIHELAGGQYNQRRKECESIAKRIGIAALRDFSPGQFEQHAGDMPVLLRKRALHVVSENARVLSAADALRRCDLSTFGQLMSESHRSLRDDFEVSCAELDLLVKLARNLPGVHGSRMTGGGFGGCTISLVEAKMVGNFMAGIAQGYREVTGIDPPIYVCSAVDGACEVT